MEDISTAPKDGTFFNTTKVNDVFWCEKMAGFVSFNNRGDAIRVYNLKTWTPIGDKNDG